MAARSFKILMHQSDGGDTDKGYCFVIISISYKDCAPISLALCSAKFDRGQNDFCINRPSVTEYGDLESAALNRITIH